MIGHLQIIVLSDFFSENLPIDFSETVKGLKWLIPHNKLPWSHGKTSTWPHHLHKFEQHTNKSFVGQLLGYPSVAPPHQHLISSNLSSHQHGRELPVPTDQGAKNIWLNENNVSIKSTPFGQPLNSGEYFMYFLVSIFIPSAISP